MHFITNARSHGRNATAFYTVNTLSSNKTIRTAAGIPTWSPTVVLICRSTAYVWQSGRDAQFSADCGRT
ncbi:hypothetical protein KCU95_g8897, partial [Aureobasidium melanogenum]